MQTKTVIVHCDVHISYTGASPVYRLFVGDELFTERTWMWTEHYLNEVITIEAPFGLYPIRYELLPHPDAHLKIKNAVIAQGPGKFRKNFSLEVHDENK